jgi:hypothetical protein
MSTELKAAFIQWVVLFITFSALFGTFESWLFSLHVFDTHSTLDVPIGKKRF